MEYPVEAAPPLREFGRRRRQLFGVGHVYLEDVGDLGKLPGHPAGQRQAAAGAREDDFGSFVLGQAGHGESQRCVGQDAGYQDAFAVEESHGPGP
jgi:hypothetical protein